jgi:endoglucanase
MSYSFRMMLVLAFTLLALPGCKKSSSSPAPLGPGPAIDPGTFLSRGINLSNWFNDYSDPAQFGTHFQAAHFQQIKSLGFQYVRLPVGCTILYHSGDPAQLNAGALLKVDDAVKKITDAGLAVVINIHPNLASFDDQVASSHAAQQDLATYWKAVAEHFKGYSATQVIFEVYNEPHVTSVNGVALAADWWLPVQENCIRAIRSVTLAHVIIAGGMEWNSLNGLTRMTPYPFDRIVYNFHFYDPFLFTHQGATWTGWDPVLKARNVPYPSSPEAVAPLVADAPTQELKDQLTWYGAQRYNEDSLLNMLRKAADWASRNHVYVTCNEFGTYKPVSPPLSRRAWVHDVRSSLEKLGIGWAMWEYDEGFGLVDYPSGDRTKPVPDEALLSALGLK